MSSLYLNFLTLLQYHTRDGRPEEAPGRQRFRNQEGANARKVGWEGAAQVERPPDGVGKIVPAAAIICLTGLWDDLWGLGPQRRTLSYNAGV